MVLTNVDSSLFVKHANKRSAIVNFYIDDLIITSDYLDETQNIHE